MGNTNKLRLYLAEKFLNGFSSDNIWLFVGKPTAWNTSGTTALGHKTYTSDTLLADIQNWDDIMSIQRVSDVSLVIPYTDISSSSSFKEFTDNEDLFDDASTDTFYGVTASKDVYKCISNNDGSTVSDIPDLIQSKAIKSTNDGYIWKFMYSIPTSDWDKYRTPTGSSIGGWIPVKRITQADDSSQWDHAMKGAIDGEILHVATTATGGFSDVSGNPFTSKLGHSVHINKDLTGEGYGSGFEATVSQHSGGNYYINVTNPGSGYRKINTIHTKTGSTYDDTGLATQLRPILSPIGGHGFDAVDELGGCRVMVSVDLTESMIDFIKENDFRKIGLLVNPYTEKSSLDYISGELLVSGNKYRESVNARQLVKAVITSASWNAAGNDGNGVRENDIKDQEFTLYDSSQTATGTKGVVVEVNPESGESTTLYLLTTAGKFDSTATSTSIRGVMLNDSNHVSNLAVSSYTQESLKKYTGKIIHVENINASDRTNSTQKLKLVVEF
tara:strand:+ start:21684 stop:23183 length:1500 start_codon:yes stop_codon:yes gene_type:complete